MAADAIKPLMRRVFFMLLLCAPALAWESDFQRSYSDNATALRAHLLSGYDRVVPPTSNRTTYSNYSGAGTDVRMQVQFFKVEGVDAAHAKMRLKVWLRYSWQDTRLAWDPAEFGGITKTFFQGKSVSAPEETEIWLPDVQPYNTAVGIESTLDASLARVEHTGEVFWSRPGLLDVLCRFSGLVAFPFDSLTCSIEFGGWALSGGYQGISLEGSGFGVSQQEATSGSSYQEHSIAEGGVSVVHNVFEYPCCPSEPWPVVRYDITLDRGSAYYWLLVIYPGLLITCLAMTVFFMSPGLTERISYATTLLLVNEVSKVTIAGLVPVCGELLWIEIFSTTCTVFCTIALLESSFVLYLYNYTDEHLLPTSWVACYHAFTRVAFKAWWSLLSRITGNLPQFHRPDYHSRYDQSLVEALEMEKEVEFESSAVVFYRRIFGMRKEEVDDEPTEADEPMGISSPSIATPPRHPPEPPPRVRRPSSEEPPDQSAPAKGTPSAFDVQRKFVEKMENNVAGSPDAASNNARPADALEAPTPSRVKPELARTTSGLSGFKGFFTRAMGGASQDDSFPKAVQRSKTQRNAEHPDVELCFNEQPSGEDMTRRLMLIENAFFMLDVKAKGWIHLRDVSRFLSFARLDMGPLERTNALCAADKHGDSRFVRLEFMDVCVHCLNAVPCDEIELALKNFELAQSMFNRRFARKWRRLAEKVDSFFRLIPLLFIVLMLALFNVHLQDNYAPTHAQQAPMFQGLAPEIWWPTAAVWGALVIAPAFVVSLISLLWLDQHYLAQRRGAASAAVIKERIRMRMTRNWSNPSVGADDSEDSARKLKNVMAAFDERMAVARARASMPAPATAGSLTQTWPGSPNWPKAAPVIRLKANQVEVAAAQP